jgi:sulfur carrier protein
MQISLNGKRTEVEDRISLEQLLDRLGFNKTFIAVICRGDIIPRESWSTRELQADEAIDVLTPMQGG